MAVVEGLGRGAAASGQDGAGEQARQGEAGDEEGAAHEDSTGCEA